MSHVTAEMDDARAAPSWRILADDLTGALDTAAMFAGTQEVPVFLHPDAAQSPSVTACTTNTANRQEPVQAWSTGTRDVSPDALHNTLQACLPWFATASDFAFKKVDSLLRGNSFAEVAWLLRHGGFTGAVFAPAFPAQGRFTRNGQHWVGAPHTPQTPLTSGTLSPTPPLVLADAFAAVGLATHMFNVPATQLDTLSGVLVPDVTCDADLAQLAGLSRSTNAQRWLWCGSAGLAWALAREWGLAGHGELGSTSHTVTALQPGHTLVVTASRHPVLRGQLTHLADSAVLTEVNAQLRDLACDQPLSAAQAQAQLAQQTHTLAHIQPRPTRLVVVGGDTLLALCLATGAHSLRAGHSPRSGWGLARLQGGLWDGVPCYSRSGAFGAPDDLSALLETVTKTHLDKETIA